MDRGSHCLTALNNTLALRYRGDHNLSSEMLQFSGFGRVNDAGNYPACAQLAARANFCVVELFQAGALVTGTQGLCLPSECTADDLQPVTATLDRVLPGALSTYGKAVLPGAKFSTTLTCGDHATALSAGGWVVVSVAIASLLLVIAAGLVQYIEREREVKAQAQAEADAVAEVVAGAAEAGATAVQAGTMGEPLFGPRDAQSSRKPRVLLPLGLARKLLLTFSPLNNASFLFTPSPAARKFTALEGIRTLSMLWIILAHTLNFFEFVGTDEPVPEVYAQTFGAWPFQAGYTHIYNGTLHRYAVVFPCMSRGASDLRGSFRRCTPHGDLDCAHAHAHAHTTCKMHMQHATCNAAHAHAQEHAHAHAYAHAHAHTHAHAHATAHVCVHAHAHAHAHVHAHAHTHAHSHAHARTCMSMTPKPQNPKADSANLFK